MERKTGRDVQYSSRDQLADEIPEADNSIGKKENDHLREDEKQKEYAKELQRKTDEN